MMSSGLSFLDALFEAICGVTTTGLSTKATLVGTPQTFLFARAWMQWYGGLGVVVLSLALVRPPEMMN
jgi:trk system potassium uptake protein TrkH